MTRKSNRCAVWLVSLALVIPMGLSGLQEGEGYEVGRALPPVDAGRDLVEITIDDAIQRALELNLDVQSVRLNPQIQGYSLQAAEAAFATTLSTTYGFNSSTNPSTSQLDGGLQTSTERQTFNASIAKTMPFYGGRLSANFNNARTATDNSFSTLNPNYRSTVGLSYNQPLLAGRKTDNQRTAVETQEIQGQISQIQLNSQLASVSYLVQVAYWGLRAAIEQIEIQRRNLAQAEELLVQNGIRVQLGHDVRPSGDPGGSPSGQCRTVPPRCRDPVAKPGARLQTAPGRGPRRPAPDADAGSHQRSGPRGASRRYRCGHRHGNGAARRPQTVTAPAGDFGARPGGNRQ